MSVAHTSGPGRKIDEKQIKRRSEICPLIASEDHSVVLYAMGSRGSAPTGHIKRISVGSD